MAIEIRLLGNEDLSLLDKVAPDVFDDPLVPERTREFLSDTRHHLVVAIEDGVVVGFVSAVHYIHPDKPHPELWINEVGVAAPHRQRGFGKGMLHVLFEAAQKLGCTEAWVLTDRDNVAAMRLYAAAGGEPPTDQVMFTFTFESKGIGPE